MLNFAPPAVGEPRALDTFERTASDDVRALVNKLKKDFEASRGRSQVRALLDRFDSINGLLNELYFVPDDWNAYGSPSPSKQSIEFARSILNSLWGESLLPDRVLPSADGGVAFVFRSDSENRAVIESLNEDETCLLLYDRQGNSKTLTWSDDAAEKRELFRLLQLHLEGVRLAAL
jgi:hypothetical protein